MSRVVEVNVSGEISGDDDLAGHKVLVAIAEHCAAIKKIMIESGAKDVSLTSDLKTKRAPKKKTPTPVPAMAAE